MSNVSLVRMLLPAARSLTLMPVASWTKSVGDVVCGTPTVSSLATTSSMVLGTCHGCGFLRAPICARSAPGRGHRGGATGEGELGPSFPPGRQP
eukprot:3964378-Prymnesium_polylepis.1